ncbi:uncharacterized protein [Diabrotica undecimpunctata]|uniref:uncharacterized protein isoform X1 n=2 Tax=Diabrotica undecimpunctata TaxID=50387 RepID=UPI003B6350F0
MYLFFQMESRSKRILELAMATEKSNNSVLMSSTDNDTTLNIQNGTSNIEDSMLREEKVDLTVPNRTRCNSTSSSSSSDSSTSSSSSSSFSEDTDDSVKDPDYEDVELRHRNRRNASCSDEQNLPFSTVNQDDILCESVNLLPREDYEMIPNNLTPIQSDPSDKENISASQQKLTNTNCSPNKVGKKRRRQEDNWQKNVVKKLRNSGKSYQTLKAKKNIPERTLKPSCREKCAFKCRLNITEERRLQLFKEYWDLGNIEKQWSFIANSVEAVIPKYRHVKIDADGNIAPSRGNNNAFFLTVAGVKTRVCKLFF